MKGALKAVKRTPHLLTSKVGMSNKSSDAETNDLVRRFGAIEESGTRLLKDATAYRDSVTNMIDSANNFGVAFATLFSPMGSEYDLERKYPSAVQTIKNITAYEADMQELKNAILPELELIETRVLAPVKDYIELLKKVRKAITKRDHKLVDYDRFNNSYTKLRDKKEKSLNDEKNLFKAEQDFEQASQDYEHHNSLLKGELPHFFEISTAFITPLFQSFYYLQLQVMYTMLEKLQAFAGEKFDMQGDIEANYREKLGDAAEQMDSLTVTKRFVSTAKMMQTTRANSVSSSSPSLNRAGSYGTSKPAVASPVRTAPPPSRFGAAAGPSSSVAAPPPYSASSSSSSIPTVGGINKRAPPPPPGKPKPKPAVTYCTALYDYEAQAAGDLSFNVGDKIEVVQKSDSAEDWWTGRLDGREGVFPGNYVQL